MRHTDEQITILLTYYFNGVHSKMCHTRFKYVDIIRLNHVQHTRNVIVQHMLNMCV